ncbi:MAG TPA: 4Fe-4S binding protein [Firmicutes bacterium]|nr:4Fe-4S binding protein [Bacillota bacterium]
MIKAKINGQLVWVPEGTSIYNAALKTGVKIPVLCGHPDLEAWGACGICVVKERNSPKLYRACATAIEEGMDIITHDAELHRIRKTVIELILSVHPNSCLTCPRNQTCELQRLAADFGVREMPFDMDVPSLPKDTSTPSIVLDPMKCIKCGRCVKVCQDMQDVWALEFIGRGHTVRMAPAGDIALNDSPCINCGQCSAHCPVGAIYERDDTALVWSGLADKAKHSVVQIAPAVRVAIGEAFGYEPGEISTGKTYAALRRLGFDTIFDTNFAADLTIMEEATEFVERFVHGKGPLPLITTCCPSWVDYMEKYHPEMIPHFSTAKSPQMMLAAMTKTYYAQKIGKKPEEIFHVSVMPCTAKKWEIIRDQEGRSSGVQDLDVSITTRELASMIKSSGIDFNNLPDEEADHALGIYSGAGTIFGVTGGVMEAALRSAYFFITGKNLEKVEFHDIRGLDGVKEAKVNIAGTEVRVAVAHSIANVAYVINRVKEALAKGEELPYHFIEVMACRGGCIGGGGQPYGTTDEVRMKRIAGIYKDDELSKVRFSHENPQIKTLYKEFLGEPLSEKSHKYLHTHYTARKIYQR